MLITDDLHQRWFLSEAYFCNKLGKDLKSWPTSTFGKVCNSIKLIKVHFLYFTLQSFNLGIQRCLLWMSHMSVCVCTHMPFDVAAPLRVAASHWVGEMGRTLNTGRGVGARRVQNHPSSLGAWDRSWSPLVMKIPSDSWFFCFTSLCVQQSFPDFPLFKSLALPRTAQACNKKCAQYGLYKSNLSLKLQARKPSAVPCRCQQLCVSFLSETFASANWC